MQKITKCHTAEVMMEFVLDLMYLEWITINLMGCLTEKI